VDEAFPDAATFFEDEVPSDGLLVRSVYDPLVATVASDGVPVSEEYAPEVATEARPVIWEEARVKASPPPLA